MGDKPPQCAPCPLFAKSFGFALDCGDPLRAKYAIGLEAAGKDEIAYRLTAPAYHDPDRDRYNTAELTRRRKLYPQLPDEFRRKGMALVGKSWGIMAQWCFRRLGIKRDDLLIFNVLRCCPSKSKAGEPYPTGDDRKKAEAICRQYDAALKAYNPKLVILTIHPAALTRSITPLPLLIRSCEKLRDCGAQGIRAALLCGGKSVKLWLGYFDSVTRFQGHYAWLTRDWYNATLTRLRDATMAKSKRSSSAAGPLARRSSSGRRVAAAGGIATLLGE